jgi:hypothetical protein
MIDKISTDKEHPHVIKAIEHLNSVLVAGETVDAWAIQRRLFSLFHRRILVAVTSGRFIKIERGLIGGFQMTDFRWQDIGDAKLKVGIFGADVQLSIFGSTDLAISKNYRGTIICNGFRKDQLQHIYRLAQAQDQAWREKRRIRELEELRAKSGGLNLGHNSGFQQSSNSSDDATVKLQLAKQMLENKLITDSDYESIKARIISGM